MFKCLDGIALNYLSRNCKYVDHCHNIRYHNKQVLYVNTTNLEDTKRALIHDGAINYLPDYCLSTHSLNAFKSVVLKYICIHSHKCLGNCFIALITFKLNINSFITNYMYCLVVYCVRM